MNLWVVLCFMFLFVQPCLLFLNVLYKTHLKLVHGESCLGCVKHVETRWQAPCVIPSFASVKYQKCTYH